jgi:hypothetical protein
MAVTDANLASTLAVLGLQITHNGVDLGVVSDFSMTPETTTYDFFSARKGKRELVKQIVTEVRLTGSFSSSNILDPTVTNMFTGATGGAMTFEATDGALVITRNNAETGGADQVISIASASVRGTGFSGEPDTEEAKYTFEFTALLEGAATNLGTITNA